MLFFAALLLFSSDRAASAQYGKRISTYDIVYRVDGARQVKLDLFRPSKPPKKGSPVVIAIHGGGWASGDKADIGGRTNRLTSSGYAVVAPNFLNSRPDRPSWPTALEDLREAVRWVRLNASAKKFDAGRIYAVGESSGGHLAHLLGAFAADSGETVPSSVTGVMAFYGATDLITQWNNPTARPNVEQFLGASLLDAPLLYDEASPISHVSSDDPSVFIAHGALDGLVEVDQVRTYASALASSNVPVNLQVLPGLGHGFGFVPNGRDLLVEGLNWLSNNP